MIKEMKYAGKFDLEERLVDFTVLILNLAEKLPKSYAGIHLSKQIIWSGTSPALQYGEAQAAESRSDFIHKMKIGLKELRDIHLFENNCEEWVSSEVNCWKYDGWKQWIDIYFCKEYWDSKK